jgi:predicted MFS family arabinose efflux permease
LLLAAVGADWCFAINGISFLAVLVSLSVMKLPAHRPNTNPQSPLRDLASGLRYVRARPEIAGLLMLSAVFSMFGFAYQSQLPAYARDILLVGPQGYGTITATVGLGAVSGALLLARFSNRMRRGRWLVTANFVFPFVLALLAVVHDFNVVLLLCYVLGLCFIAQGNLTNVLLQTRVEDGMRGRVMGFFTLTFFGFSPFGNLIVGSLAESAGLVTALLVSAGSVFVLSQLVVWKAPSIKDT